jgi:hypothetical protein
MGVGKKWKKPGRRESAEVEEAIGKATTSLPPPLLPFGCAGLLDWPASSGLEAKEEDTIVGRRIDDGIDQPIDDDDDCCNARMGNGMANGPGGQFLAAGRFPADGQ